MRMVRSVNEAAAPYATFSSLLLLFFFHKQVQYVPQHSVPKHCQLYTSLNVKDKVSCQHETIFAISIVCIIILIFVD